MAKKKRNLNGPVLLALVLFVMLSVAAYYLSNKNRSTAFIHYREFGIDLPAQYEIHGIDVSRYQEDISWSDVRSMEVKNVKLHFAFIKATEGLGRVDKKFQRNWQHAKKAGMVKGAYHFYLPGKSGKDQAVNFIQTVQLKKGDLPPVLDIELVNGISAKVIQQGAMEWLTAVEKKFNVKPIIYTSATFYSTYLAGKFDEYPLWVAHYLVKDKPRINREWSFWQHNETGQVNGIRNKVDFNVFNGDSSAFEKLLIQ